MDALGALEARGLLAQTSDRRRLGEHLSDGSRVVYAGFDPTAPSLQVGNLVTLLMLRRLQLLGHRPIVLVGGATGLIGDPSGREDERALNDGETVERWVAGIRRQVSRFVDLADGSGWVLNNMDWTRGLDVVAFLRDVGKHFSVNAMMQRDSVRTRLARDGAGISYTEFSYMLLQAYDFLQLARRYECTVQLGGSDQWGNIVSGVDLVRRALQRQAFALTHPLVTRQDGTKLGKTAAGAVWLDSDRTSCYAFHQFWLNTADADVASFLRCFTLLDEERIAAAEAEQRDHPQRRSGQRLLADSVTRLVHGRDELESAQRIATALFDGDVRTLSAADFKQLEHDGMDSAKVTDGTGLLTAIASTGLAPSNSAARKLVESGGISVNGERRTDAEARLRTSDALFGRYFAVRRGRKNWCLVVVEA